MTLEATFLAAAAEYDRKQAKAAQAMLSPIAEAPSPPPEDVVMNDPEEDDARTRTPSPSPPPPPTTAPRPPSQAQEGTGRDDDGDHHSHTEATGNQAPWGDEQLAQALQDEEDALESASYYAPAPSDKAGPSTLRTATLAATPARDDSEDDEEAEDRRAGGERELRSPDLEPREDIQEHGTPTPASRKGKEREQPWSGGWTVVKGREARPKQAVHPLPPKPPQPPSQEPESDPTGPDDFLRRAGVHPKRPRSPSPKGNVQQGPPRPTTPRSEPRPAKRLRTQHGEPHVPHKFSLRDPVVHSTGTLNQQLREARDPSSIPTVRPPMPPPRNLLAMPPPTEQDEAPQTQEPEHSPDEPLPPTQGLYDSSIQFTEAPPEGFKTIQGNAATWIIKNVKKEQISIWDKIESGKVFTFMYGKSYADARRQDPRKPSFDTLATTLVAARLRADASLIHFSPPKQEVETGKTNFPPWGGVVYGLTAEQEDRLIAQKCLSTRYGTLLIFPVAHQLPELMCTLDFLPDVEASVIEDMVVKVLQQPYNREHLALIARELGGATAHTSVEALSNAIIKGLWVEKLNAHSAGGIANPSYNLYLKAISDSIAVWVNLKRLFQGLVYQHGEIGPGRVTKGFHCQGCHGADHFFGLCPFLDVPGWNGPRPTPKPPARGDAPQRTYRPQYNDATLPPRDLRHTSSVTSSDGQG